MRTIGVNRTFNAVTFKGSGIGDDDPHGEVRTNSSLIDAVGDNGTVQKALKIDKTIGVKVSPDAPVYSHLDRVYSHLDRVYSHLDGVRSWKR